MPEPLLSQSRGPGPVSIKPTDSTSATSFILHKPKKEKKKINIHRRCPPLEPLEPGSSAASFSALNSHSLPPSKLGLGPLLPIMY